MFGVADRGKKSTVISEYQIFKLPIVSFSVVLIAGFDRLLSSPEQIFQ